MSYVQRGMVVGEEVASQPIHEAVSQLFADLTKITSHQGMDQSLVVDNFTQLSFSLLGQDIVADRQWVRPIVKTERFPEMIQGLSHWPKQGREWCT